MQQLGLVWEKFWNMLLIPNTGYFLEIAAVTGILYFVARTSSRLRALIAVAILCAITWTVGLPIMIEVGVVGLGAHWWGNKIFRLQTDFLATLAGFGAATMLYFVTTTLTSNLVFARLFVLGLCLAPYLVVTRARRKLPALLSAFSRYLENLTLLDWILLATAWVFASTPQTHWDAAQANLYIAKWYVALNSFAPLTEALSSLFPQGGNLYYTFFLAHGLRALQLGIVMPLAIVLLLLRTCAKEGKWSPWIQTIIYLALTLPIVLFQGSNGYYDLVNLLFLMSAYTFIITERAWIPAALFVGLAASLKLFPLCFLPGVLIGYYLQVLPSWDRFRNTVMIGVVACLPLLASGVRSYQATGSPIFPFFQQYFPTPLLWDKSDKLEENPMIQTKLSQTTWLKGGVFAYPLLTYLHSTEYLEAQPYYTGLIYVLFLPLQVYGLYLSLRQWRTRDAQINLVIFTAFYLVGIVTRYYRYLWPFQFMWLISSLAILGKHWKATRLSRLFWIGATVVGLANWYSLIGYYRYYPLDTTKLFRPDYYLVQDNIPGPIGYLNQHLRDEEYVLDASTFLLPRVQVRSRVYQCNWYFQRGVIRLQEPGALDQFRYLITDVTSNKPNFCTPSVSAAIKAQEYHVVYTDNFYQIYEKN